jgi:hypothetical protein
MFRVILYTIVPLALPFAVYAAAAYWTNLRKGNPSLPGWEEGNWFWAGVVGVVFAGAALVFLAMSGAPTDSRYTPPHLENGRIVPGQYNDGPRQ